MLVLRATWIVGTAIAIAALMASSGMAAAGPVPSKAAERSPTTSLAALKVAKTIPLGKSPDGGAYDSINFDVYVTNEKSNNVTVVNSVTHTHSSIAVGKSPSGVVFDPYNAHLYVPNLNSSSVSIINGATNTVSATVSLGSGYHPGSAYFDPANGNILVFNNQTYPKSTIAWMIVNVTNKVTKLTLGLGLTEVPVYNPGSMDLYVTNYFSSTVSVIAPSGKVTTLTVAGSPSFAFYDPAAKDVWVPLAATSITGHPTIDLISSTNTVSGPIVLPAPVNTLLGYTATYDPYNGRDYVLGWNYTTNQSYAIALLPGVAIGGLVVLGKGTAFFASYIDPANKDLYVVKLPKDFVVLNNTTKVVKTLTTTQLVLNLVYDPTLKDMVGAGDVNLTTVSLLYSITSANAISSLKVGKLAVAFLYDPKDTYVYVANIGSDSLDLIS